MYLDNYIIRNVSNGWQWRVDVPASKTGQAWLELPINAAKPGLGTSVCNLLTNHHQTIDYTTERTPGYGIISLAFHRSVSKEDFVGLAILRYVQRVSWKGTSSCLHHIARPTGGTHLECRYRMQGCVFHRDIKTVGWKPSWSSLNSEYHNTLAPFFKPS